MIRLTTLSAQGLAAAAICLSCYSGYAVTVTVDPLVGTNTSTIASNVTADQIEALPVGRGVAWLATLQATDNQTGNEAAVIFRSTDNGASWSAAERADPINTTGFRMRNPHLATDALGAAMISWIQSTPASVSGTPRFIQSLNAGQTWSAPINIDQLETNAEADHALETDGHGVWGAVWSNPNGIRFSRALGSPATFLGTITISGTIPGFSPDLAADGHGNWLAVWTTRGPSVDTDIALARSTDNGVSWSSPVFLNANPTTDFTSESFPQVVFGKDGESVVIWQQFGTGIFSTHSTNSGGSWSTPIKIADAFGDFAPELAFDQEQAIFATFDQRLPGTFRRSIFLTQTTNGGQSWSPASQILTQFPYDGGNALAPHIAFNHRGRGILAFAEELVPGDPVPNRRGYTMGLNFSPIVPTRIDLVQSTRIANAETGSQVLTYNFETQTTYIQPYNASSSIEFDWRAPEDDDFHGVFHYDYLTGRFNSAQYFSLDR